MNDAILAMMKPYDCQNQKDYENVLKEIVQEIALMGLSRSDFFTKASFYGGTALRIFYHLPRFSEDLDFSLDQREENFDIVQYFSFIEQELFAYHFQMKVTKKEKSKMTAVQSAFIKGNTVINILEITSKEDLISGMNPQAVMKIKFEIDTNPPSGAEYEYKNGIRPANYRVKLYDTASLFAGKISAVLARDYKNRVKGRDFFDYVWYLRNGYKVNLFHLQKRLEQSGKWNEKETLTLSRLKELLKARFESIDFSKAKEDVQPFLAPAEQRGLSLWDSSFFTDITNEYLQSKE